MNPGDEAAKRHFQRVSQAYELLRDAERRQRYDASGRWEEDRSSSAPGWDTTWANFVRDGDVIAEVVRLYVEMVKDEALQAADLARQGRWTEAWYVVREHKRLIMVLAGLLVLFRSPVVVGIVARVMLPVIARPNVYMLIWSRLVAAAHGQRARLRQRSADREAQAARSRWEASDGAGTAQGDRGSSGEPGGSKSTSGVRRRR